ncbi:hypothetical protein GQ53DRAFT_720301 [Thozetella sp. PMI_491]|nr:hypothetical protein GQ53DRAFT_720301 [Thozetella sp. PMI_491]
MNLASMIATDSPEDNPSRGSRPTARFWRRLVAYVGRPTAIPLFGEYDGLVRLNVVHLQTDLARIKGEIFQSKTTSEDQMKALCQTLHNYTNAIRDYEYMRQLIVPPSVSNYQMSIMNAFPELSSMPGEPLGTRYLTFRTVLRPQEDGVREFLRLYLPSRLSWTRTERDIRLNDYHHGRAPEIYSPFVDSLARFIMAVACGAALIVPMVVMTFDPSRNKSLITVSISVLLFAIFLASGIGATNTEVLAATATYAAVLVVFVGTSGTTT